MSSAPWVTHFGFTRTPFSKTIPASQLCDRASHQEAVARIRFCISKSLLGVITGEVGVGKTVAVRAATNQLDATAHHIIYVATPTFGARGLYLTIVHALGAKPRAQKADLIAQTQALLAAEEHERRRRVVFIIDEAHLLAPEQLEELRLLTNAEMGSQSPFALLLVGSANACASAAPGRACGARSAHCYALPVGADGPGRGRPVPAPPSGAGGSDRSAVCR
jgi:type II secretory pathway predicted ATPase ExeA